jgi:hypothetical protein
MYSYEGLKGFYKGNGTSCIRAAPFSGIEFYTYDKLKKVLNYLNLLQDKTKL